MKRRPVIEKAIFASGRLHHPIGPEETPRAEQDPPLGGRKKDNRDGDRNGKTGKAVPRGERKQGPGTPPRR